MTGTPDENALETVKIMVPVLVDSDELAVSLAKSGNSHEQLLRLIQDVDTEVADWDFTQMVAGLFVDLLHEYAIEEDDGDLLEAIERLQQVLSKS